MKNYLELKNVTFRYGAEVIVEQLDFAVKKGEFVVLIGPSGCGKSTLLSLAAGLVKPETGEVLMDGERLDGPTLKTSVIFQHNSLFPWMTVEKNVRFGLKQAKPELSKKKQKERSLKALRQVGLLEAAKKYPAELSGGMQQRTAIARMLAMDSALLLLDEPFAAIDPKRRGELQALLTELWQKGRENGEKKTVLFVTHDIDEAILLADRIVYFGKRGVLKEIEVSLERPRRAENLAGSGCFCGLRKELVDLFSREEAE